MHEHAVLDILEQHGIHLLATLPCDRTKDLCYLIPDRFNEVGLTREEDGVGVCAGAWLGGERPAMVIQSSGIGNMFNALMSLTSTYHLPLPILASWRGVYREKIEAQIPFNRVLPALLRDAGIASTYIGGCGELNRIGDVIEDAFTLHRPHVALISPRCWEGEGGCAVPSLPPRFRHSKLWYDRTIRDPVMTRYDAIRVITRHLDDEALVSNIGVPGKELFSLRDRPLNFYMLGSYTQATPIGLGISLAVPERRIMVLDGDGSLLGTGILPVVVQKKVKNLTIFCMDNGTFGSTGDQPTPACVQVDLELLAQAHGFRDTAKVQTEEELIEFLEGSRKGPSFAHVLIRPGNARVQEIPFSPDTIRQRFMAALAVRTRRQID